MMEMQGPVYCFFRGDFLDVEFVSLRSYIHAVEKVTDDCLFDPA